MRGIPRFLGFYLLGITLASGASAAFGQTLRPEQLSPIAQIVEEEIRAKNIPGAVVLIGNQGKTVYREAFGLRLLSPKKPMTLDTIFDVASICHGVSP